MISNIINFLSSNKIRIVLITLILTLISSNAFLYNIIENRNDKIEKLSGMLEKSNSETVKEILICNNDKINEKINRENNELKILVEEIQKSKKLITEINEKNNLEKIEIKNKLDVFKNKKCLNDKVDKEYLEKIKEVLK